MFDCAVVRDYVGKTTMSLVSLENLARQYGVSDEQIIAAKACLHSKKRLMKRTRKARL
jgi:hypothetical protein